MSNRVTNKDLKTLVDQLNRKSKCSTDPYTNGKANVGTYYIDGAYGGVRLVQLVNESGGIRVISPFSYGTKRELYVFLSGMLEAIES